ncbi:MAG: hypothetical protein NVS3B5_01570 [Sphingomicrobium sp.]
MKIRVTDFETTGLPPEAAICQIGHCDVMVDDDGRGPRVGVPSAIFVNPGRPIPPDSRAVHHICDRDVEGAPAVDTGLMQLMAGEPDIFCAHNAVFERAFFVGNGKWICTRKVAMRLWPAVPNFQNQTLRYWLDVDGSHEFEAHLAMPPHRAHADAYVTAHVLARAIMTGTSIDQMVEWSNQPSLLPGNINFGKHRGTPWSQLPADYLNWMCGAQDMDEDKKFTAKYWLDRRRSDGR